MMHPLQSMAGAAAAVDGSKGLGPLLAGWDGDLADAAPKSQAQRAAPVTAGVDVLKILSACGQCVSALYCCSVPACLCCRWSTCCCQHCMLKFSTWTHGKAAWLLRA